MERELKHGRKFAFHLAGNAEWIDRNRGENELDLAVALYCFCNPLTSIACLSGGTTALRFRLDIRAFVWLTDRKNSAGPVGILESRRVIDSEELLACKMDLHAQLRSLFVEGLCVDHLGCRAEQPTRHINFLDDKL